MDSSDSAHKEMLKLAVGEFLGIPFPPATWIPPRSKPLIQVPQVRCPRNGGNYRPCKSHPQKSSDEVESVIPQCVEIHHVYIHVRNHYLPFPSGVYKLLWILIRRKPSVAEYHDVFFIFLHTGGSLTLPHQTISVSET